MSNWLQLSYIRVYSVAPLRFFKFLILLGDPLILIKHLFSDAYASLFFCHPRPLRAYHLPLPDEVFLLAIG